MRALENQHVGRTWGDLHRAQLEHPLIDRAPETIRDASATGGGPHPVIHETATINAVRFISLEFPAALPPYNGSPRIGALASER